MLGNAITKLLGRADEPPGSDHQRSWFGSVRGGPLQFGMPAELRQRTWADDHESPSHVWGTSGRAAEQRPACPPNGVGMVSPRSLLASLPAAREGAPAWRTVWTTASYCVRRFGAQGGVRRSPTPAATARCCCPTRLPPFDSRRCTVGTRPIAVRSWFLIQSKPAGVDARAHRVLPALLAEYRIRDGRR